MSLATSSSLDIPTAAVFEPLLQPARYKGAHGGRGSGKSHFFGESLVDRHLDRGMRSVCIRENQKSLKESAKRLIEDKIQAMKLGYRHGFRVYKELIETPGDGIILFQGMQDHTAESIKSLEGFDTAWVEEAQTLSATSLKLLRPTIRGDNSELWFSWNPRHETDPVDMMLRQGIRPTNSIVVEANWNDNPWFPAVLEQERRDCLDADPDQYNHIWEGGYITTAEGAYYAKQLAKAREEGRIGKVARDPLNQIKVFVDIGGTSGKSDAFSMWVCQWIKKEIRILDYYEAVGQEIGDHVGWLRKYDYGNAQINLPHDGKKMDSVYRVSYESAFKDAGFKVKVRPNLGAGAAVKRIEEGRRLFPRIWFDEDRCSAGLKALGWYHEKRDENRNVGLGPEHDWASHGADAFGEMCVAYKEPTPTRSNRKSSPSRVQ